MRAIHPSIKQCHLGQILNGQNSGEQTRIGAIARAMICDRPKDQPTRSELFVLTPERLFSVRLSPPRLIASRFPSELQLSW